MVTEDQFYNFFKVRIKGYHSNILMLTDEICLFQFYLYERKVSDRLHIIHVTDFFFCKCACINIYAYVLFVS